MTPEQMAAALDLLGITEPDLDTAAFALAEPDPAGVVRAVQRRDLERVAVYLHRHQQGVTIVNPAWTLISRGHPAAKAVYWHELCELDELARLGKTDLQRPATAWDHVYWRAHAWACWKEAEYWSIWSGMEGAYAPVAAFLEVHPLRTENPQEIPEVRRQLQNSWGLAPRSASRVELGRALAFYRTKEMTVPAILQWLRR